MSQQEQTQLLPEQSPQQKTTNDTINNPLRSFSIIKPITSNRNPIYHAYDNKSNRHVILKTFQFRSAVNKSYIREKNHLTSLNHPNVVQLYDAVDSTLSNLQIIEKKISYLALEYASHGDLLDIISKYGQIPEILTRSLFHQLIDAVSYLHIKNVAHLDLKVDNILIDENFQLKLIDFDLSQNLDSGFLEAKGTPGYRAPEVKIGVCSDFRAADIYSAAIVLFVMLTGHPPYLEISKGCENEFDGFYKLLRRNTTRFWEVHTKHQKKPDLFCDDFKELVCWMASEEARERPSVEDIKKSKWYNGPVLSREEYKEEMRKYLTVAC